MSAVESLEAFLVSYCSWLVLSREYYLASGVHATYGQVSMQATDLIYVVRLVAFSQGVLTTRQHETIQC